MDYISMKHSFMLDNIASNSNILLYSNNHRTNKQAMASVTMTAFLGGATSAAISKQLPATNRRGTLVVKASKIDGDEKKINVVGKEESNNGRRELFFGVAAAAACSLAKIAIAIAEEPKRGSLEAKKKYAPVCVTMPTAKICRN